MNITRKLADHEHAQAKVVITDSITLPQVIDIVLVSYCTNIVYVSVDTCGKKYLYSAQGYTQEPQLNTLGGSAVNIWIVPIMTLNPLQGRVK